MGKKKNPIKSHTMELPRLIVIGEKNINEFGKFLRSLNNPKKVSLLSGIYVKNLFRKRLNIPLLLQKFDMCGITQKIMKLS